MNSKQQTGKISSLKRLFGFIKPDHAQDEEVYFRTDLFHGEPSLQEGDSVSFELDENSDTPRARSVCRQAKLEIPVQGAPKRSIVTQSRAGLLSWAYLGYMPTVLSKLSAMALSEPEKWEFRGATPDPARPHPILMSYLMNTFDRLMLENKVVVSAKSHVAAFNTGLVDSRYEPIYAVFVPNRDKRTAWLLDDFCIRAEGRVGQMMMRNFKEAPPAANYFQDPAELLYDVRAGSPELDWDHVIIERIERYPEAFLREECPKGVVSMNLAAMSVDEKSAYFEQFRLALKKDASQYRRIIARVRHAVDVSIKRVAWNFKTAIPTYYPRVRKLQLLLPLCISSDDHVDLALAVEKTPAGNYLGHTVLPLGWAYKNARLVCRPDSDWLAPEVISDSGDEEE